MDNKEDKMTLKEKKSSLEAQFWNDKQEVDENTSLMKEIKKICKDVEFNN